MAKTGKILIVDDDPLVLEALFEIFTDDYEVILADSGKEALKLLDRHGDLDTVVLDIRMARMDGLETACKIRDVNPGLPVIFHTGYPGDYSEREIDSDHKPFDYVGKNERPSRLQRSVRNAVYMHRLEAHSSDLVELARRQHGMVGRSRLMREVYQTIEKVGPTDNKVMILGPTGTGKELVARAIHRSSRRAKRRLAVFNCNHKAPDLVESELFGHLRGSFTGAVSDSIGMFEYADGGTLFLDEIGNLDITTQGKLLRVLETGEMHRIGSPEIIRVDVRLICAANTDLEKMIEEKTFRQDLYYRLKGIRIMLPALSERREDIPDLIDFFTENYCRKRDDGIKVFEPGARDLMIEYSWPGNVRQLQDTVQSLIDLSLSHLITRKEVEQYLSYAGAEQNGQGGLADRIREFKKLTIIQALARNSGNVSAAARELKVDASNLSKIIKDLDINSGN